MSELEMTRAANGLAALILALVCCWCILSTKINDGIAMKCGLVLAFFGFGTFAAFVFADLCSNAICPYDLRPGDLARSILCVNVGAIVCASAYVWRRKKQGKSLRRLSDFMTLDGPIR